MPTNDQKLFQLISSSSVQTIGGVITVLRALDSELANDDGLKWFNLLYLKVTEAYARDRGRSGGKMVNG